jgi:hypothetical protein
MKRSETFLIELVASVPPERTNEIVDNLNRYGKVVEQSSKNSVRKSYWDGDLDKVTIVIRKDLASLNSAYKLILSMQRVSGLQEKEIRTIEIHKWEEE